jgi:sugar phosphate isomerase/epimerase
MTAKRAGGTGIENIEKLRRLGFDYAELPVVEMMALSAHEFDELAARVADSGINCEACNNLFPKSIKLTGEAAEHSAALRYFEEATHRLRRLGATVAGFGSGSARTVPDGFPPEKAYEQLIGLLRKMDELSRGLTIALEPLRKAECNIINTFEEAFRLQRDAACASVKLLADFYHLTEEKEPAESITRYGRVFLAHVHIANPSGRVFPFAPEESGYASFFKALRSIGYDGRISCEAYSSNFAADAEKTLGFFKAQVRAAGW